MATKFQQTDTCPVPDESLISLQPSGKPSNSAAAYIDHDRLMDCIHCGLCLSQCPTYAEEGLEADSPRGRIYIMRSFVEGRAEPTPTLVEHLDLCLGCRACETACPSGVQYGALLEGTREYLRENYPRPSKDRLISKVIEATFPYPNRLDASLLPVRVLRRTGVMKLLRRTGLMKLFGYMGEMESMLPDLPPMRRRLQFPVKWQARGPKQANVGMITGCVMQVMQTRVNEATARVLCKAGCSVNAPKEQVCCGALHAHSGAMDEARNLAKKNIEVFENWEAQNGELDAVVINAAGCGAALKEYSHWLHDEPQWKERAEKFSHKVKDVSEFLAQDNYKSRLEALMPEIGHTSHSTLHTPHLNDVPREVIPNNAGASSVRDANGEITDRRENWEEALDADGQVSVDEATDGHRPQPPHSGAAPQESPFPSGDMEQNKRPCAATCMTYHDACHLAHGQGIRTQPRELLDTVSEHQPATEVVPLGESEMCCGSAGIYNITQPEMAMRLLERKMKHIEKTGAQVVVTGNPGCAMQLMLGAKKFDVPVKVLHPVEVLDAATGGIVGKQKQ